MRNRSIGTPVPGKFRSGDRATNLRTCGEIPSGQRCSIEQSIRMGAGSNAYYLCLIRWNGRSAWARESELRAIDHPP